MAHDDVLTGLAEVLGSVARIDRADVSPEARFDADLGIDSLTLVDVVVATEDRFGMVIPDEEWSRFETVGNAVRYIERAAVLPA
jgi:acyl carrier protein